MTYENIISDIKEHKPASLYLLHGEESFFIDEVSNAIENNFLDESEKAFDQIVVYGKDVNAVDLMNTARRAPMMSRKNVVIVKEAQHLEKKEFENLNHYVSNPVESTVFVFCHKNKSLDKRKALYKSFKKNGVVFESKGVKEYQISNWIVKFLRGKGFKAGEEAVQLLADHLGTNLGHITNELNKLIINIKGTKVIDASLVEKHVGINRTYSVFALQKCIGNKQKGKAFRIVQHFRSNPKAGPIQMVIPILFKYFQKIYSFHHFKHLPDREISERIGMRNSYFLKDYKLAAMHYSPRDCQRIFQVLLQYDLRSKGVNDGQTKSGDLLQELLVKIMG